MSQMIRRILANFVFSAILVGSAVVLSFAGDLVMPNPKLDVAFVFDQSQSMLAEEHEPGVERAMTGLKNWVQEYSGGKDDKFHFAVFPCRDFNNDKRLFKDRLTPQDALSWIPPNNNFHSENLVGQCFEAIKSANVFEESTGSRSDAPRVLLYLSDCNFLLPHDQVGLDAMKEFQSSFKKIGGYLALICTTVEENGVWVFNYKAIKEEVILPAINNDNESLIVFYNDTQFKKELKERLPKMTVRVTNCDSGESCKCESSWVSVKGENKETVECPEKVTSGCKCLEKPGPGRVTDKDDKPVRVVTDENGNPVTDEYGKPIPYTDGKPVEVTDKDGKPVRVVTDENGNPVTDEYGNPIPYTDGKPEPRKFTDKDGNLIRVVTDEYGNPVTDEYGNPIPYKDDKTYATGNTVQAEKSGEKRNKDDENTTIIIGAVVGGLLFLILLIVILVVVVMKRRRSKKAGPKAKSGITTDVSPKEKQEKMKGIKADISCKDKDRSKASTYKQAKSGKSPQSSVSAPKSKMSKAGKSPQSSVSTPKSKMSKAGKSPQASVSAPKSKASKVGKSKK